MSDAVMDQLAAEGLPLSLILAVATNGVIGHKNQMPWHLPAELQYFKRVTMGKPIIMGRKTWESLGRPLPGRLNLVVSQQERHDTGAENFTTLGQAWQRANEWGVEHCANEVMLIGGAQLFAAALPWAKRLYLTRVDLQPEGDVFLPEWRTPEWRCVSSEAHAAENGNPAYVCEVWERS